MPDTPTAPPALTFNDLQHCRAAELLTNPPPAVAYHEMWPRLCTGAKAAAVDPPKAAALGFLAKISSMMPSSLLAAALHPVPMGTSL